MKLPTSYLQYIEESKNLTKDNFQPQLSSNTDREIFRRYFPFSDTATPAYLFDYSQGKYPFVNKRMSSITGQSHNYFLDGGVNYTINLWHKEDFKIFSQKILIENIKFFMKIPPEKHSEYLVSYNYRIKRKSGETVNILQESIFINSTATGLPLSSLGILTNISDFANDGKIVHTITHLRPNTLQIFDEPVIKNIYFSCEKDSIISKREIEVLKWISEGFSSAEIARKLFISVNTINNHRRNLLQKTNSKNVVDLLQYAITNKIL